MEIKEIDKYRIITPLSSKLLQRDMMRLKEEILNSTSAKIGIDMSFVNDCTIDFIDLINEFKNLSLFNISSDIFALLLGMNVDKTLSLYVSEMDFLDNRHRLLNRKFVLV